MTIEELAIVVERLRVEAEGCDPALIDKVIAAGVPVSKASIGIVRALLPFIAAELAGVARGRAEKFRIVKEQLEEAMMVKATNDARIIENSYRDAALAIEAHARKMGEAS